MAIATSDATAVSGSLARNASVTLGINSPPDFTLTASPVSQAILQGGATSFTATVTPQNDFSGVVTFDVTGLPSGATAKFIPPLVTDSGSSTLDITTTSDVLNGTYSLLITGTSGDLSHSASVTLTVNSSGGVPDFQLTATPVAQTIVAGNSASYTITVIPENGFDSDVSLIVSDLPPRLRAVFDPASIPGGAGSSILTIDTSRSARGNITLTITGTGGGLSRTTRVSLNITRGRS